MATHPTPRSRRATARLVCGLAFACMASGATWLSRVAVALVFTAGMLATAGATRVVVSEADVLAERGEDSETAEQGRFHVQAPRRMRSGPGPHTFEIRGPRAPRILAPRRPQAPSPSWQRPRRTDPPDEEADESLL